MNILSTYLNWFLFHILNCLICHTGRMRLAVLSFSTLRMRLKRHHHVHTDKLGGILASKQVRSWMRSGRIRRRRCTHSGLDWREDIELLVIWMSWSCATFVMNLCDELVLQIRRRRCTHSGLRWWVTENATLTGHWKGYDDMSLKRLRWCVTEKTTMTNDRWLKRLRWWVMVVTEPPLKK
jgi:hypothetical protein